MNQQSDEILGLTMSELAYFILFATFLIVFVLFPPFDQLRSQLDASERERQAAAGIIQSLRSQLLSRPTMQSQRELQAQVADLESEANLRSPWRPSCVAAGVAQQYLFDVTIVSVGRYELADGALVSAEQLSVRFASELQRARDSDCVHQIGVWRSPILANEVYDDELNRLGQTYYLHRNGSK